MGDDLVSNIGDIDMGNRSAASNSVVDVEQAPTKILKSLPSTRLNSRGIKEHFSHENEK